MWGDGKPCGWFHELAYTRYEYSGWGGQQTELVYSKNLRVLTLMLGHSASFWWAGGPGEGGRGLFESSVHAFTCCSSGSTVLKVKYYRRMGWALTCVE